MTSKVRLLAGVLSAGALLGIVAGTPTSAAAAGNIGNGTLTGLSLGPRAKLGVWRILCIEPATNGGTFAVEDPDGVVVGRAVVGTAFAGPLNLLINDGTADFAAGDAFLVTVPQTTDARLSVATAADGTAEPALILAADADATLAPVDVMGYARADVLASALSYGDGHTADTVRAALQRRGITVVG